MTTALLDRQRLAHALTNTTVGHTIDYHERVTSTMILAHERAADPAVRSGTVVIAEEQTAGRGRRQRRWDAPPGQALLLSVILKAPLPMPLHQLPMFAGLAALTAITSCFPRLHDRVGLKWPNDLLLGHGMADAGKVGGILVENSFYGSALSHVVIGMGLNVLQDTTVLPPALPGAPAPTSLLHYLSTLPTPPPAALSPTPMPSVPDRTALLIALCQAWARLLGPQLVDDGQPGALAVPTVIERWRSHLWTLGHPVVVQTATGATTIANALCQGIALDVTDEGHLLVCDATGTVHQFAAGDVSVRLDEV